MDISVVIAYTNKENLIDTLDSFDEKYKHYKYEVILIGFNNDNKFTLSDTNSFNFKIISLELNQNNCKNIGQAYNVGFRKASGETIIFQNAECKHIGDILGFILKNMKENYYLIFNNFIITNKNLLNNIIKNPEEGKNYIVRNNLRANNDNITFCNAINKKQLFTIGGFDEQFKNGYGSHIEQINFIIRKILKLQVMSMKTRYACCVNSPIDNSNLDRQLIQLNRNILTNHYFNNNSLTDITTTKWRKTDYFTNLELSNNEYISELSNQLNSIQTEINDFENEKERLIRLSLLENKIKDLRHKEKENERILRELAEKKEEMELEKIRELEISVTELITQRNQYLERYPLLKQIPAIEKKYSEQINLLSKKYQEQEALINNLQSQIS